jgi:hypothetical protein
MPLTDRIHGSTARVDAVLGSLAAREAERQRAEDAERMMADAAQARADAERRREYQARYDEAFSAFGTRAPAPVEGERPGVYRKRLYEHLRRRLPSSNEWASTRADDIPPSAASQIEAMVIKAAMAEGLRPSAENLPRDGSLLRRERTDEHGARSVEWMGRESFIKQMGREGGRVLRICDPRTGIVHWGGAFERV